jgi:hypothetical protein
MLNRLKEEFWDAAVNGLGYEPVLDMKRSHIIYLDHFVIVLGELESADRESALNAVDNLLDDVLELRRGYTPAKASDIYMIMAAPLGSTNSAAWRLLVAEIERDDRLARKHIWLPNADGSNFEELIEASFLAKPWNTAPEDANKLKLLNQGVDIPDGWKAVLLDSDLEGLALAEKLVALEGAPTS